MASLDLGAQLSGHTFAFMLIFTRISAAFTLFPGIGEALVPGRLRLFLAFAIALILYTPLQPVMPPLPDKEAQLALLIATEALIGIFFGALLRLLMQTLEIAGSVISMQLGLSNAMMLNPSQATQSDLLSIFFSTAGLVLLFVTGLDHMLIRGLVDTYNIFPPGSVLPPGDIVQSYTHLMMNCFATGVELAAPLLIIGLLMLAIMGFMQRLMPQVQLFLVMIPLQIWGGLMIFMITLGAIFTVWLSFFDESFSKFFTR